MNFLNRLIFRVLKKDRALKHPQKERKDKWIKYLIAGVLLIVLLSMFPGDGALQFSDLKEGSISNRQVVAPFSFEILKTKKEIEKDRELAVQKVYPIFIDDKDQVELSLKGLNSFFNDVEKIRYLVFNNGSLKSALMDSLFILYPISVMDTFAIEQMVDPRGGISKKKLQEFKKELQEIMKDILAVGVLNVEKKKLMNPDRRLYVVVNDEEVLRSFDEFYDMDEAKNRVVNTLKDLYTKKRYFAQLGFGIINFFLRPNLIYDEESHKQRILEARARVPLSSGFVYENERIVDRHERITPEIRRKLTSLASKMAEKGMIEKGFRKVWPVMGKLMFIMVVFFLFIIFIYQNNPEILKETKLLVLVSLIVFMVSFFTFLIHRLDGSEYLVPSALGTILLATLFGSNLGYASAAVFSILIGGLWGNEFNLTVVSFFVGVVGVVTIKHLRSRRQLVNAIFYLACAYILSITFMGFLRFLPFREIVREWPWGAFAGLLTPVIASGLLPIAESLFDITTDFTLLELSNLNHPLLKELSVRAPGTYNHSIIVGNLSEAAAQAVGANSLLARVGSYYHDVGKIEKAEYFTENQITGKNPHQKLTSRMSCLILMNHVKKGLELAEKYKLPKSIKDIIHQHHGTTVMSYFYQQALDRSDPKETREEDYRYQGPKPQTKEAAIVMLADTLEAATRSIKTPNHSRLKGLIETLVDERFREGELDESPLTLKDLEKIKESFLTILAGIYHTRVEYPDKKNNKPEHSNGD